MKNTKASKQSRGTAKPAKSSSRTKPSKPSPTRPPSSSGIIEPVKGKKPKDTLRVQAQRTALLKARMKRELTHGIGMGSNDNANTGGVAEGGGFSPYTLS